MMVGWLFFLVLFKAEKGLNLVAKYPHSPLNRVSHVFASGFGFAILSGLITFSTLLSEAFGPG
jgi:hypothetical protein